MKRNWRNSSYKIYDKLETLSMIKNTITEQQKNEKLSLTEICSQLNKIV